MNEFEGCPDCKSTKADIKRVVTGLCLSGVIHSLLCECLKCGTHYMITAKGVEEV